MQEKLALLTAQVFLGTHLYTCFERHELVFAIKQSKQHETTLSHVAFTQKVNLLLIADR